MPFLNSKTAKSRIERSFAFKGFVPCAAVWLVGVIAVDLVALARQNDATPPAKTEVKSHRSHPQAKTPAEHNAEMFRGTKQALDQLGTFPDIPPQPKKGDSAKPASAQPPKTRTPDAGREAARSEPKTPAEHNARMFRGTQQALDQLGTFPAIPSQPAKPGTRKRPHRQPKSQTNPAPVAAH